MRDTISGLFIFLEGQFDVGDIVDLTTSAGTVSGTVETLNLRTTAIRQYDGSLSTVPNGLDRGDEQPDARLGSRGGRHARRAGRGSRSRPRGPGASCSSEIQEQPPLGEWLRQPPQVVLGVTQVTDTAQVIRVAAETMPSHRVDTERLLRAKIVARLGERGYQRRRR